MTAEDVPDDVRIFLHEHIETYEQIAVLALLIAHAAESWSSDGIAAATHISHEDAVTALAELAEKGLVRMTTANDAPSFAFVAEAATSETIHRLAGLYASQPLEIMRLMNANAMERVRTSMARSFASAFLVGRKK